MRICVLSGSPKGKYSITYQTVLYLEKLYKDCEFCTLHVGSGIKKMEKEFEGVRERIERADIILFCYPVYTFVVPYQLHRFIELIKERNVNVAGKCAMQISTSKHFFDVTAHRFIKDNCDDLQLHYLGGLSLDMEDMLCEKGQKYITDFWNSAMWRYNNGLYLPSAAPVTPANFGYNPSGIVTDKREGKKIVIVSSGDKDDGVLKSMIDDFCNVAPYNCEVVELANYPFKGGCLGCLTCATNGKCVYKDGFDSFLREKIQSGDTIIYAFRVKDHSMGSLMKLYDDRQFCNGHRTVTMGSPIGYIVAGDLTGETNLKEIMTARADVGGNYLAGIANDVDGVVALAKTLEYALENNITAAPTFYNVGGTRIFRDLIWLMRGMMKADHKFFKKNKMYDFPQKRRGTMLKMKFVGALVSNPVIRSKIGNKMNEGMVAPYKEVLENLDKNNKRGE